MIPPAIGPAGENGSMAASKELITIEKCAKRRDIPLKRVALRKFAIENRLAIRIGGSDRHPRLVVNPDEVRKAIESNRYVKRTRESQKQVRFRSARRTLHEDVNC